MAGELVLSPRRAFGNALMAPGSWLAVRKANPSANILNGKIKIIKLLNSSVVVLFLC
jgi:hypothetical protein